MAALINIVYCYISNSKQWVMQMWKQKLIKKVVHYRLVCHVALLLLQIESPVLIHHSLEDKRSKSIEEREEEYNKVRQRIFNQDVSFCCLFCFLLSLSN